MHVKPLDVFIIACGVYSLWYGIIMLKDPKQMKKNPLWRLSFPFMGSEVEEFFLQYAKPFGIFGIGLGILLMLLAFWGLLTPE